MHVLLEPPSPKTLHWSFGLIWFDLEALPAVLVHLGDYKKLTTVEFPPTGFRPKVLTERFTVYMS